MLLTLIHPLNIYARIQRFLITLTPLSSYIDKSFVLINTFEDVSMVSSRKFLNTSCRYVFIYKSIAPFLVFVFQTSSRSVMVSVCHLTCYGDAKPCCAGMNDHKADLWGDRLRVREEVGHRNASARKDHLLRIARSKCGHPWYSRRNYSRRHSARRRLGDINAV